MRLSASTCGARWSGSWRCTTACSGRKGFPTGHVLFREGEPADTCCFLLEGRARVLRRDHTGEERDIGSWFAPAVLGALAPAGSGPRSATCVIGAPSLVAVLGAGTLREVLRRTDAEGAHLRWLLLAAFTETLSSATAYLRRVPAGAGAPPADLAELHAILEGARR